jgi:hypothetical protein
VKAEYARFERVPSDFDADVWVRLPRGRSNSLIDRAIDLGLLPTSHRRRTAHLMDPSAPETARILVSSPDVWPYHTLALAAEAVVEVERNAELYWPGRWGGSIGAFLLHTDHPLPNGKPRVRAGFDKGREIDFSCRASTLVDTYLVDGLFGCPPRAPRGEVAELYAQLLLDNLEENLHVFGADTLQFVRQALTRLDLLDTAKALAEQSVQPDVKLQRRVMTGVFRAQRSYESRNARYRTYD